MRAILAALLVVTAAYAGCLAPAALDPAGSDPAAYLENLSVLQFDLLPGESVFYEASVDGTQLHLRLFRPDAAEDWKAPTILVMSPYFGPDSRAGYSQTDPTTWDAAAPPAYWRYQWLVDHFVPRGYAVAFADVRGTGESGGCLEQTGPLQTQDGYDTVQWLAEQPWSNGKVGMYGKSYDAETQQSTATLAPPGLVTIVPVSSVSGQYEYSYYDGVPYTLQTMLSNVGYAAGDGLQPGSTVEAHLAYPERVGCNVDHFRQGADDSGTWNPYWEAREFRHQVEGVKASVLYVHGLQDWNVKPVAIRGWFDALESPKLGMFGQWAHDYPEQNNFRDEWSRQDWQALVWRWYDHWLLGRDTGIASMLGTVQVQDSAGAWRVQSAFPAADATPVSFHLIDDALATAPGEGAARSYAEGPLPNPLGLLDGIVPADGELRYESAPLDAPLRWSGWPTLTLDVTLDKDDAHFAVWLVDVAPDGTETWVNRAYLSAQHRDGVDAPAPVPVGERVAYELRFFPSDTVVDAGHKLALRVMPADGWASAAGNGHTATVHGGVLTLPTVAPGPEAFLDVPLGDPITAPVL
jgi:predicted acyl esterase